MPQAARRFSLRKALIIFLGVLPFLGAGYGWLVWQSPWLYQPPVDFPLPEQSSANQTVFAYGTLKSPLVRFLIMHRITGAQPAVLPGYRKKGLDLVPAEPEQQVEGIVFEATPEEMQRLDRYERLGIRYERQLEYLKSGQQAWVYQLLP